MTGLSLHNSDLVAFQSFFGQKDGFGERTFAKLLNDTNEGVVFAILARFKNTLLELQDTVREGLMGDDHQSIWKMCHKVSGSAALLGFEEFGRVSGLLSHELQNSAHLDVGQKRELACYLRDCETLITDLNSKCPNLSQAL
jgi:HPt (histidine-containing phosphotransfer) domain-containing protein